MTEVLNLQQEGPEVPGEEKRSDASWLLCGGTKKSNSSHFFC